jgi:transcriptional regulator with XRE-family HTH domain
VPVLSPDEAHVRLATRIREIARLKGLAIEALADKAGVSRSHVWNVLSGRFSPTVEFVAKLAAGLEVDIVELFRKPKE